MKNILYISLLFFSNLILTQDYHVAKNGDDSNPGTKDKPFLTIFGKYPFFASLKLNSQSS